MLFAFDLYDLDNSGEIDQDEMERIVVEIYGTGDRTSYMAKQLILEINKLSGVDMVSINKEQFCKFVHCKRACVICPSPSVRTHSSS